MKSRFRAALFLSKVISMKALLSLFIISMFLGCHDAKETGNDNKTDSSQNNSLIKTGKEIEPKLFAAGSIQMFFYDDPDGDSLRYARFYTYHNTSDTAIIKTITRILAQPASQFTEAKKCRSEGKIYMLNNGEPVKTLYFSTRSEDCSYLYFIKDGLFYYFSATENLKKQLSEYRKKARK